MSRSLDRVEGAHCCNLKVVGSSHITDKNKSIMTSIKIYGHFCLNGNGSDGIHPFII